MRLDLLDFLVHASVGALEHHDHGEHGFSAIFGADAGEDRDPEGDLGDVSDQDGGAVFRFDDDAFDVFSRGGHAHAADHHALAVLFQHAAARIAVVLLQSFDDLIDGDSAGEEGAGVDDDLVLLDAAIGGVHFGNAGDGAKLGGNEPVLEGSKLHRRPVFALDGVHVDIAETGGDGAELGRFYPFRQLLLDVVEAFIHQLSGEVNVYVVLERDGDLGEAILA